MIAALLLAWLPGLTAPPPNGPRCVLVLGDSITADGRYTAYLDAFYATRFPDREVRFLNLGLPSETVSGLSEPGHPFPRPDVHDRLDRALAAIKPDVVLACYGMNDGIYHPYSQDRFARFQDGILKLVSRCRDRGIRVDLVTPPPFDPQPVRASLKGIQANEFGWTGPYENYEQEVLSRYAAWMLTLSGVGFSPIDAHGIIRDHLARVRRENPSYHLAEDGVHLDASGQWLIAQAVLNAWGVPGVVDEAQIDAKAGKIVAGEVSGLRQEAGTLFFEWATRVPMPHDPDWNAELAGLEGIDARFNRHRLAVTGLDGPRYRILEGDRAIGEATAADLAEGLDLLTFPELSTNRRASEIGRLIRGRERLLGPSWRDAVGHSRPGTEKGLPLGEATARAAVISAEITRLARPVPIPLRIESKGDGRGR